MKLLYHMYPILLGLLGAPIGAALLTPAFYLLLCGLMTEQQGRRGLLAGALGIPLGVASGFVAGYTGACWLRDGAGGLLGRTLCGLALAAPAGLASAGAALIYGARVAEARGIGAHARERLAWGLLHIALPIGLLVGAAAFVAGHAVAP